MRCAAEEEAEASWRVFNQALWPAVLFQQAHGKQLHQQDTYIHDHTRTKLGGRTLSSS